MTQLNLIGRLGSDEIRTTQQQAKGRDRFRTPDNVLEGAEHGEPAEIIFKREGLEVVNQSSAFRSKINQAKERSTWVRKT